MKTLIIYDNCEEPIRFGIVYGDHSKLHGTIINSAEQQQFEQAAINLLFVPSGDFNILLSDSIELIENKQWDKVAVITLLP